MAKIYRLPGDRDRQYIQQAISLQVTGRIGQRAMNDMIARVLRKRGIRKLVCNSFRVRDAGDIQTPTGLHPVIVIEGQASQDGSCPACGGHEGSWLRGDRYIAVFCRRCGCIYERRLTGAETC